MSDARRVYSTESGDLRRRDEGPPPEAARGDGTVRVTLERSGRRGKAVTVVRGIPDGELAQVAAELKRRCAAGGAVKGGAIEIQGDHRDAVAAQLRAGGRVVKLAGG